MPDPTQEQERVVGGSIWEKDDELFIVERVYGAQEHPSEGGRPITLVKLRCIDPMPRHTRLEKFLDQYEPYDPEKP